MTKWKIMLPQSGRPAIVDTEVLCIPAKSKIASVREMGKAVDIFCHGLSGQYLATLRCPKCLYLKPHAKFYQTGSYCRTCHCIVVRDWQIRNMAKVQKAKRDYHKRMVLRRTKGW